MPQCGATVATARDTAAAWSKLWYVTPALLLAPDGRYSRAERWQAFISGAWPDLLEGTLDAANIMAAKKRRAQTEASLRLAASRMARQPNGLSRTAAALAAGPNAASPRTAATLQQLGTKHPAGDDAADLAAAQAAGWQRAAEADGPTAATVFTATRLRTTVMTSAASAAAGPNGLSVLHLQQVLSSGGDAVARSLLAELTWLAQTSYAAPETLPEAFWTLHKAARLSAVGAKARPIACGDTIRRLFGRCYCHQNKERFATLLEAVGQFGVAVKGGVEIVAAAGQLVYESGGILLTVDGSNAFNAVSRSAVLAQVAEHVPDLYPYAAQLYGAGSEAALLYGLEGVAAPAVVPSRQGVQQGDPLGPLLFALALLPIMRDFKAQFPHLSLPGFLDDLTICCLTGRPLAHDLPGVRDAYLWLKQRLQAIGIAVNDAKTSCLINEATLQSAPAAHLHRVQEWASEQLEGLQVVAGLLLVGVPIGHHAYLQEAVASVLRSCPSDRLLREIVSIRDDTQLAYALLRLCYHAKATFLARNVHPEATGGELERFDALVIAALASITQEGAAVTSPGAAGEPSAWDAAVHLIRDAAWDQSPPVAFTQQQQQQVRLPHSYGGLGLPALSLRRDAAFTARTSTVIKSAVASLADPVRAVLEQRILELPLLQQLQLAINSLLTSKGIERESLSSLLRPELTSWALDASDDSATAYKAWLFGLAEAEAEAVPPPVRVQAALTRLVQKKQAADFREGLSHIADSDSRLLAFARWQSQCGRGASAYLSVLPTDEYGMHFPGDMLREALRRHLGIERPNPGGLCANAACTAVPQSGAHARSCSKGGEQHHRHTQLVKTVVRTLKSCGIVGVREEDGAPFALHNPTLRMDITLPGGQLQMPSLQRDGSLHLPPREPDAGKGALLDVSTVDPTCPTYVQANAMTHGEAIRLRTEEKHTTYLHKFDAASYTLIPFVLDLFGSSGPHLREFVKAVAQHQAHRSESSQLVGFFTQQWRQRLSVTLQRCVSESVARHYRKTRPIPGNPQVVPDILSYTRVRLLVLPQPAVVVVQNVAIVGDAA